MKYFSKDTKDCITLVTFEEGNRRTQGGKGRHPAYPSGPFKF